VLFIKKHKILITKLKFVGIEICCFVSWLLDLCFFFFLNNYSTALFYLCFLFFSGTKEVDRLSVSRSPDIQIKRHGLYCSKTINVSSVIRSLLFLLLRTRRLLFSFFYPCGVFFISIFVKLKNRWLLYFKVEI